MQGNTLAYLEQADQDVPRCVGCGTHLTELTVPVDSSWEEDRCARCAQQEFDARYEEERNLRDHEDRFFEEEPFNFEDSFDDPENAEETDDEDYDWNTDPDFDSLLENTLNQTVV